MPQHCIRKLLTIGFAAAIAGFAAGCMTSSSKKAQQVQQVQEGEPGAYSIAVSDKAVDTAVAKAGDYCHAKGQKLSDARAVGNSVTFRCLGDPRPQ